ncbi:MAG TPA: choice-of-anchor P family protein [Actinopolymorphaceae bacterium]
MNSRTTGRRALAVLASTLVGVGSFSTAAMAAPAQEPASQASDPKPIITLGGASYGAYAYDNAKKHATGPVGRATMHCVKEGGLRNEANGAGTDLGPIGSAGVTDSTVSTFEENGWKGTVSQTKVAGAKLLGGVVKVGAITSKTEGRTNGGRYEATNQSKIASLTVAGTPIDVDVPPNTKVDLSLPGLGSIGDITINKQNKGWFDGEYRANTEALHIQVLKDNPLGLKVGSTVRLGVSGVVLSKPVFTQLGGNGFATKASVGGKLVTHGPTASAYMPCGGGTNHAAVQTLALKGLIDAGAGETKIRGDYAENAATAVVSNEITGLSVLDGLISVDALKAQATATKKTTPIGALSVQSALVTRSADVTLSAEGTEFVNLKVAGKELLDADIAPNTTLKVAQIGTVTLNKVVEAGNRISVTMLELTIENPKLAEDLGLDIGAKVEVGYASAVTKN